MYNDEISLDSNLSDYVQPPNLIKDLQNAMISSGRHRLESRIPELKESICEFYFNRFGVDISPSRVLVIDNWHLLLPKILKIEDNIFIPNIGLYDLKEKIFNRKLIPINGINPDQQFQITPETLIQSWRRNIGAVFLTNPDTLAGKFITEKQIKSILRVTEKRTAKLIVDESNISLYYSKKMNSIAEFTDQAFIVSRFSDFFGLKDWNLTWIITPPKYNEKLNGFEEELSVFPSSIEQYGAVSAFNNETLFFLENRRGEFLNRRDFLIQELIKLGFKISFIPEGGINLMADCSNIGISSSLLSKQFINNFKSSNVLTKPLPQVAIRKSDKYLRFSFGRDLNFIQQAINNIDSYLQG